MNNSPENEFKSIWNLVYKSIKDSGELADEALTVWFSDTGLRELTAERAVFAVATEFRYNTIVSRYADTLKKHLFEVIGYEPSVEIVFDPTGYVPPVLDGEGVVDSPLELAKRNIRKKMEEERDREGVREPDAEAEAEAAEQARPKFQSTTGTGKEKLTYNPDYTFENFVVGGSNSFAHSVAKNVAENPALEYNPLFLYGPSGVGKTHLMYAITNRAMQLYPDMNIVFVKGEEFANQLIECLSHKYGGKIFRDKYRTVDMLLIDDVHFIAGRESVQEEFFHTFNTLFEGHRQIIVSSDRPPKDMHTLESRLRTRFESGLLADVQSPDFDLRIAIIRRKADNVGIRLDEEVEQYLAESIGSSVRQIEGVIKKISARYILTGELPNLDTVRIMMSDYLREKHVPSVTPNKVIEIAAAHFGVSAEEIIGVRRDKNIRLARNAAMYVIRKATTMSLPEIGKVFNRNYSTVINNCKAAETLADADSGYAAELAEIEREAKA